MGVQPLRTHWLRVWLARMLWLLSAWLLAGSAHALDLSQTWQTHWDLDGSLTAQQAMQPNLPWQADARHGNHGFRPGVLWLRVVLPASPEASERVARRWLVLGKPYIDRIDIYAWGNSVALATLGDSVPLPPKLLYPSHHTLAVPASAQPQVWLLRVQTSSAMNVSAHLLQDDELAQTVPRELLTAGLFMTLYLLSAGMYAVSALVLRQPVQLAYSFYMLCLLAIFLGTQQPLLLNAWLGSPGWANWVTGFGILITPAAGGLLWIMILDLRRTQPRWFKVYVSLMVVCVLSLFSVNTPYYRLAALSAVLGVLVLSVTSISLALWAMRQPSRRVRLGLYVLAFGMPVLTAMALNLSVAGIVTPRPWFGMAFDASAVLQVLFLAIANNRSVRSLERASREAVFHQRMMVEQKAQIQSFSAFVAHELLNPLARIGRSSEMALRETELPAKTLRRLTDIRAWAFEAGKLVEVFLNNAALQSGQAQVKPICIDLSAWMADVQTEFTLNYPQAVLQLRWPDGQPQVLLDPLLTKLALENILINALKYAGPQCAIRIEASIEPSGVLFSVEDDGPGLRPEQYQQLGETALLRQPTEDKPGFGLGLSLVATIAKAQGGHLAAQPRQPHGVRWVLALQTQSSQA